MINATVESRVEDTISPARVVTAAAGFEAIRMIRHPLTLLGVALSVWLMWTLGGSVAPILERDSVFLAGAMLPLAATTLLVANMAVLRQRKTPELLDATPLTEQQRMLAVQVGVLGPVVVTLLLQAIGLTYLLTGGPIGTIDWPELAAGPAAVALLGVGGVFLARRLPHPAVPLVALVLLAVVQYVASPDAQLFSSPEPTANIEWLAPWMTPSAFAPVENLAERPSVLHLVYLIVLTLTMGALAVPTGGVAQLMSLTAGVAVAAGIVVVSLALPSEPRPLFDWRGAAANQTCESIDGIEYCAFELYADWIPRWEATLEGVHALAPVSAHRVMQRPHNIGFDEPSVVTADGLILASTHWDRDDAVPYFSLDLALRAAQSAVGLPTTRQLRPYTEAEIESIVEQNPGYPGDLRAQLEAEGEHEAECSALGQARSVVSFWLAGAGVDKGLEGWQQVLSERPWTSTFSFNNVHRYGTLLGVDDARLALRLLELPTADVHEKLLARWDQVIDPSTSSADLASWFGLTIPPAQEQDFHVEPCP